MEEVSKVVKAKIVKPCRVVAVEACEEVPVVLGKIIPEVSRKITDLGNLNDFSQISSVLYSYLGHRCLSGDVEALKFLYSNAWEEKPALIRTICELQLRLTSIDIKKDTSGIYNDEFLYYWGMVCLGEVSSLILQNLGTAAFCFKRIETVIPKAKARLAFIRLLKTKERPKSENNVRRIEILRRWAVKGDLFSRIVLSKIVFSNFLEEKQESDPNPPILAVRLLDTPCQKGHPVALRFCEKAGEYLASTGVSNTSDMRIGSGFRMNPDPKDKRIAGFRVNSDTLLDF
jgi:hypothetical protein